MSQYGGLITEVLYPFGRTALTSTGAQYGTTVSTGIVADIFATIESASIPVPSNAMITELEVGLTIGGTVVTTTAAIIVKYQIKDNAQSSYDTLLASTSLLGVVSTTTLVDVTFSGRITPSSGTYFTGKGPYDVLATIACGSTTKAQGAMKNVSYIRHVYYLVG